MINEVITQLKRDEGEKKAAGRHVAYQDHLGYWTLGIGRLIDARRGGGLTDHEAEYLLSNDVHRCARQLSDKLPWFSGLDQARRGALINMAFQLGVNGLLGFKKSLGLMASGYYKAAADEFLISNWAKQTPARAKRVTDQIRSGEWV